MTTCILAIDPGLTGAKRRRKSRDVEGPIQKAIVDGLRALLPRDWIVMHVANKPRSKIAGGREKRMGAVSGWPDIQIAGSVLGAPRMWFIEVKTDKGRLSPEQKAIRALLEAQGFAYGVARSWDEAMDLAQVWHLPLRTKPSIPQVAA